MSERAKRRIEKIEQALKPQLGDVVILMPGEPIPDHIDLNADPPPLIIRIVAV